MTNPFRTDGPFYYFTSLTPDYFNCLIPGDFTNTRRFSGHGLPAGLAEVEMIERARAKRLW